MSFVSAQLVGVRCWPTEDLRPPRRDVVDGAARLDSAGEERARQLVLLDAVVERVDHALQRRS